MVEKAQSVTAAVTETSLREKGRKAWSEGVHNHRRGEETMLTNYQSNRL